MTKTKHERLVEMWQRGSTDRQISNVLDWTIEEVRLTLRQLRRLGVPLRPPPPPPGEHELDLAALERRVDVAKLRAIALAAKEST